MKRAFEAAYVAFLKGGDHRSKMIACGVEGLQEGCPGAALARLSGAEHEDEDTLLRLFRSAAAECGVELPPENEADDWLAVKAFEHAAQREGVLSPAEEFDVNLRYVFARATRWTDERMRAFVEHFGRFVGRTGSIDTYDTWLDELRRMSDLVQRTDGVFHKDVVARIVDVIESASYGAPDERQVAASREIARLVGTRVQLLHSPDADLEHQWTCEPHTPARKAAIDAMRTWCHLHDLTDLAVFAEARHGYGDTNGFFGIDYPGDLDGRHLAHGEAIPDGYVEAYAWYGEHDGPTHRMPEAEYLELLRQFLLLHDRPELAARIGALLVEGDR